MDKQSSALLHTLITSSDPFYDLVNLPQNEFSLTFIPTHPPIHTHTHTHTPTHKSIGVLCPPFADLLDDGDVGEQVMVLCGRHGFPQSFVTLEVAHQDAQAVHVWMLGRDDLKNGLSNDHTHLINCACDGAVPICNMC